MRGYYEIVCPRCKSPDIEETDVIWVGPEECDVYFSCVNCGCDFWVRAHLMYEDKAHVIEHPDIFEVMEELSNK